jgi:sodium-dependent dicarboxylate transporter 2/3/5
MPGEEEGAGQNRTLGGFVLAPIAFAGLWLAPLDVPEPAHRLAAVLGAVVVLWITEAIPMAMTAFLGVALTIPLGIATPADAFAPFADPLIFLFIGTLMLAQAIFFHGLDRRFAFAMLSLPGVGARPLRVLAARRWVRDPMWISNTATVAMMPPIGLSLLAVPSPTKRRRRYAVFSVGVARRVRRLARPSARRRT